MIENDQEKNYSVCHDELTLKGKIKKIEKRKSINIQRKIIPSNSCNCSPNDDKNEEITS